MRLELSGGDMLMFPAPSVDFSLKAMCSLWESLRKMMSAFFKKKKKLETRASREAVWSQVEIARRAEKELRQCLGER